MLRAALTLTRRLVFATTLLFLLICGAEVVVRIYEVTTNTSICQQADGTCSDPSKLTIPSWSVHQELKPSAIARVRCRDSEREVELKTNSRGLRGVEPVVPKPSNLYRIVVMGDEAIYAPETSESDHFCARLQALLQQRSETQIEVINAGVPGHCPLTEFVFFKQRLMSLQPDLVLLHFDWSDVADDRQIRRLVHRDESGIPLSCPNSKMVASKKERPHETWRRHFRLLDWALSAISLEWKQRVARQKATSRDADTNSYAWLREEHPENNKEFWLAVTPIADLANLCRSINCQFVLMTSPKPWQVSPRCSRGPGVRLNAGVARDAYYPNRTPFEVLAGYANHHNIPMIDASRVMATGPDAEENFLHHAPRWSARGHDRLAELVAKYSMAKILGPWNRSSAQGNQRPYVRMWPENSEIQWTGGQTSPDGRTQRN
jgi:hypothetical protein